MNVKLLPVKLTISFEDLDKVDIRVGPSTLPSTPSTSLGTSSLGIRSGSSLALRGEGGIV